MILQKDRGIEPESTAGSCAALTPRALQPFYWGETGAEPWEPLLTELYPKTSPNIRTKPKSDLCDVTERLCRRANSPPEGTCRPSQTTRCSLALDQPPAKPSELLWARQAACLAAKPGSGSQPVTPPGVRHSQQPTEAGNFGENNSGRPTSPSPSRCHTAALPPTGRLRVLKDGSTQS